MARIIEQTVYTLAELKEVNPRGFEAALQKLGEWVTEGADWFEFVIDGWQEKLAELGFGYYSEGRTGGRAEIQFSGFWSQGDGASFTAPVDLPLFIEKHYEGHEAARLLRIVEAADASAKITRGSSRYAHELTVGVEFAPWWMTTEDRPLKRYKRALIALEENLIETARGYMQDIYRDLEAEYDYRTSEEALLEMAEANEYEFYSDGGLV